LHLVFNLGYTHAGYALKSTGEIHHCTHCITVAGYLIKLPHAKLPQAAFAINLLPFTVFHALSVIHSLWTVNGKYMVNSEW
jgi:hypothetical protein